MNIRKLSMAVTASLGLSITAVNAQSDGLEEIFVEGSRAYIGDFDSLEIPQVDTILDAGILEEAGVTNLNEALDLSASVARQNNFGGLWNSFSIRGFSGDINLPSGYLVNGFNAGRGFAGPRDIAGIESIEVLKGPRGAVFGRGEPGGIVNLSTKRPSFEEGGEFQATVGSWEQARVTGDYQTVLGENENIGIRFVGFYEDAESFRDTVETEKFGFYPSVTWLASDHTRLTYELEYTDQAIPQDRGVAFTEEFGFTPRDNFLGEPGDGPIDTEVIGHQFEIEHDLNNTWSVLAGVGIRETTLIGNATETNFDGRQTLFLDGTTVSRFFRFRDFDSDYNVVRAELKGAFNTGGLSHRLIVGADYDEFENRQIIERFRGPFIGTDAAEIDLATLDAEALLLIDANDPIYGQFDTPVGGPNTDRDEVLEGFGIYIQDQISFSDQFQVRIGGRFDDVEQEITNLLNDPATTDSLDDTRFSPQLGAIYKINQNTSLYASYGEGFRQQSGADFEGNAHDLNITESTEIGVKVDLGDSSSYTTGTLSLTAFHIDQSNILVNDDRPEATAVGFFSFSAGEAESEGIELEANLTFGNNTHFWLSYAYTDAIHASANPDENFGSQIEVGDQLINSPENQLNIQVSTGLNVANINGRIGAGLQYTDDRAGFTGFDFRLPSYTTARIFGEIRPSDRFAIRLDIDNLFDETFYTDSFANVWVQPGTPRQFRLTGKYSF